MVFGSAFARGGTTTPPLVFCVHGLIFLLGR